MDLRKLHNIIKRELIDSLCDCKVILDAGCGCGGDLPKWKSGMVVYACDPNEQSLLEARKRVRATKASVHFFNGDISNTPIQLYDAICYNFSIQYVFASKDLFFKTIDCIYNRTRVGSKLVGVVPDSEELMLHRGEYIRKSRFTGNFGDSVEFYIKDAPYYKNGPVSEPVCYKEILTKYLYDIGFQLDVWEHFVSFSTGTISDLYSKFIFTRIY